MSKPTLVQSLLKQPSQTYRNADTTSKKEYYSTKQEMMRIAAETARGHSNDAPEPSRTAAARGAANGSATTSRLPIATVAERRRLPRRPPIDDSDGDSDDSDDDDDDIFFTPNTSPRTSMASSAATIRRLSRRSLHADSHLPLQIPPDIPSQTSSLTPTIAVPSTRTPSTTTASQTRAKHTLSSSSSLSSTSLEAHSLFSDYIGSGESTLITNTRPSGSADGTGRSKDESNAHLRSTTTDARWRNQPSKSTEATPPSTKPTSPPQSNSTKSTTTPDATAGSALINKKNVGSKRTTYTHLGVSQATNGDSNPSTKAKDNELSNRPKPAAPASNGTPLPPANGTLAKKSASPRQPHTFSAFASISASTTTTTPTSPGSSASAIPSSSVTSQPTAKDASPASPRTDRSSGPSSPASNTDSRMAIPTSMSTATKTAPPQSKHRRDQSTPSPSTTTSTTSTTSTKSVPSSASKSKPSEPISTSATKTSALRKKPPIVKPGSTLAPLSDMDVLFEEDEDGPLTPRMETMGLSDNSSTPPGWDWTADTLSNQSTSSPSSHTRSLRHTSDPRRRAHARAQSLDRDSSSSTSSTSTSRARTQQAPPKTLTAEVQALVSSFPTAGERPSKGTQGYTALVLPRAPAPSTPPSGRLVKPRPPGMITSGRIDLTLDGVAQTTMASVEVVRGLGARNAAGVLGKLGFGRKRTLSSGVAARGPAPLPLPTSTAAARGDGNGADGTMHNAPAMQPPAVIEAQSTPLAFTSYRAPPDHIPSGSVLVQVWAVGLDGVDARLVGCGLGRGGFGAGLRQDSAESAGRPSGMEQETDAEDLGEEQEQEQNGVESTGIEDTEDETGDEPSTASRKGPLAALGRSISLRLSRGGTNKNKDKASSSPSKQTNAQRSAPAALSKPRSNTMPSTSAAPSARPDISLPKRSFSLKRNNTASSNGTTTISAAASSNKNVKGSEKKASGAGMHVADVGYIPGRSFVGRVLECGWDVGEDVVRKGEWVIGLLDVRKGGALTEFIVVDRHRIHRVPYPQMPEDAHEAPPGSIPTSTSTLTLDQLALLPLCGLLAYRAIRTFIFAFSSSHDGHPQPGTANYNGSSNAGSKHTRPLLEHDQGYKRRAIVLRGHDGIGAMAVQMLVQRGWRVSVHVPFSSVPAHTPQEVSERFMHMVEQRARDWGADEVIFDDGEEGGMDDGRGAAVRVLESLREDGDIFDAVLDTVGGKVVWTAAERLLKFQGQPTSPGLAADGSKGALRRRGVGQFTTLVGHTPERVIPTARDNFRAGLRALRMGSANGAGGGHAVEGGGDGKGQGKVGYAWVSVAQDVDWEGDDVGETLGTVLRLALDERVRPLTEGLGMDGRSQSRVVPFEQAPYLFVDNGPLTDGGTMVVTIA